MKKKHKHKWQIVGIASSGPDHPDVPVRHIPFTSARTLYAACLCGKIKYINEKKESEI